MIAWQCTPSFGIVMVGPVDRAVRQLVVERAGEDARGRGLADAAHAGEDPGLRDAAGLERVRDRAHHGVLADQVVEGRGAVFARQHAVDAAWRLRASVGGPVRASAPVRCSCRSSDGADPRSAAASRMTNRDGELSGRLTSDPNRCSLGLLPSGPDPVGEWLVHRQPPGLYIGRTARECKPPASERRRASFRTANPYRIARILPERRLPHDRHPPAGRSIRSSRATPSRSATCRCRACCSINDANYPWLLLVPRRPASCEIIDLDEVEQAQLMTEIARAARALKAVTACDKLNVAALGNVVPQLHVHVIARRRRRRRPGRSRSGARRRRAVRPAERDRLIDALRAAIGSAERPRLRRRTRHAQRLTPRRTVPCPLAPISAPSRASAIPQA